METFLNISEVIKKKNSRLYKLLPGFVLRYIEKIIHQNDLNRDLTIIKDSKGIEKFEAFMKLRNVDLQIIGSENIPTEGSFIFAANHPMGGPDGIVFILAVSKFFRNIKFLVNDILMHIPDVESVFLPINKHGLNHREYAQMIKDAYDSNNHILIFPAGVVSRKINGKIADLPWQKSFISHARKYKRDIIPVYIDGKNSKFFYNLASFRKKMGIRANLEMFYLVDELYKHQNETITVHFGEPVKYTDLTNTKTAQQWADEIRNKTYAMSQN